MDREKFGLVVHRGLEGAQTVLGCRRVIMLIPSAADLYRTRTRSDWRRNRLTVSRSCKLSPVNRSTDLWSGCARWWEESELYMLRGCRHSRIFYEGLAFGQR